MKIYPFKIPIKPHVLRYLTKEFSSPYRVSDSDTIGPMLIQFLRRPEMTTQSLASVDQMSSSWSIEITDHYVIDRGACHLGSRNILTFNTYVDGLMKEILYHKIAEYVRRDEQQKQAILDFMLEYSISESDLSFDAWKKAMQRLKKKKESKSE